MYSAVIATTCMNRQAFLEVSLPTWRALGIPIVVLDYSSARPLPAYPGVTVARVSGQPHFNIGKAKNTAVRAAREAHPEATHIFTLDCDIKITRPDFFTLYPLRPDIYYQGALPHTTGTAIYSVDAFEVANGYDERLIGYWSDEVDLYARLRFLSGMGVRNMAWGLEHQPHTDRWSNYPVPGSIGGNRDSGKWEDQARELVPFEFISQVEGVPA